MLVRNSVVSKIHWMQCLIAVVLLGFGSQASAQASTQPGADTKVDAATKAGADTKAGKQPSTPADMRGPEEIIRSTTVEMLAAIEGAKHYYDKDAERFYAEVDRILLPVVDFQGFARGVMGKYASKEEYDKLKTDNERQAFKDRIKRFDPKLRSTMVSSYSKGLLAVNTDAIEIVPMDEKAQQRVAEGEAVQVVQLVKSGGEKPYVIKYLFKPSRNGEWKVRNVDVDGVDLGRVYRSQFSASVRDLDGEVDKVDKAVDNWTYSELTEAGS